MIDDAELERAYAAFRRAQSPDDHTRAHTWDAIASRISRGETGPIIATAKPVRRRPRATVVACVGGLLAAVIIGGIFLPVAETVDRGSDRDAVQAADFAAPTTGGTNDAVVIDDELEILPDPPRRRRRATADEGATDDAAPIDPEPTSVVDAATTDLDVETDADARPTSRLHVRRRPLPPPEEAPPSEVVEPPRAPPPVGDEARLLQRAHSALARRDPAAALEIVRDHARRFPTTTFAREREALELLSQCALGREAAVRDALAAFVSTHRGSALADRVGRACLEHGAR